MTIKARIVNNVYSNTSHVTINRMDKEYTDYQVTDSNTSHVTINPKWTSGSMDVNIFKYISCYY